MAGISGQEDGVVVVLTTVPDEDVGTTIARALVDERLAACVNRIPGVVSVYRFEGAVHEDTEQLLIIKTMKKKVGEIEVRLAVLHPYDVPEIVSIDPASVSGPYAAWLRSVTE